MISTKHTKKIKKIVEEFFEKMTIPVMVQVKITKRGKEELEATVEESAEGELPPTRTVEESAEGELPPTRTVEGSREAESPPRARAARPSRTPVDINIKTENPQVLIGEKGRTLNQIQRLMGKMFNKKIKAGVYINLDVNEYKKKKMDYLKSLAKDLADEVALTKKEKVMSPMNSYERRIIHLELSDRPEVKTESEGEEPNRKVVIRPN